MLLTTPSPWNPLSSLWRKGCHLRTALASPGAEAGHVDSSEMRSRPSGAWPEASGGALESHCSSEASKRTRRRSSARGALAEGSEVGVSSSRPQKCTSKGI